jgi:hypothetical protein
MMKLPSQEYLAECFNYDTAEGKLFWRTRPRKHFGSHDAWREWNDRFAKRLAFNTYDHQNKEFVGNLDGTWLKTHKVIYKLLTGTEPACVFHKNNKTDDNRIDNLSDDIDATTNIDIPVFVVCWNKEKQAWGVQQNKKIGRKDEYFVCREFPTKQEALAYKNNRDREARHHG